MAWGGVCVGGASEASGARVGAPARRDAVRCALRGHRAGPKGRRKRADAARRARSRLGRARWGQLEHVRRSSGSCGSASRVGAGRRCARCGRDATQVDPGLGAALVAPARPTRRGRSWQPLGLWPAAPPAASPGAVRHHRRRPRTIRRARRGCAPPERDGAGHEERARPTRRWTWRREALRPNFEEGHNQRKTSGDYHVDVASAEPPECARGGFERLRSTRVVHEPRRGPRWPPGPYSSGRPDLLVQDPGPPGPSAITGEPRGVVRSWCAFSDPSAEVYTNPGSVIRQVAEGSRAPFRAPSGARRAAPWATSDTNERKRVRGVIRGLLPA